jgi:hypothetical protein
MSSWRAIGSAPASAFSTASAASSGVERALEASSFSIEVTSRGAIVGLKLKGFVERVGNAVRAATGFEAHFSHVPIVGLGPEYASRDEGDPPVGGVRRSGVRTPPQRSFAVSSCRAR